MYFKPPGKEPDFWMPFVLRKGGRVEKFAGKIHQDNLAKLKSARVWGTGVYDGQMVGRDHILHTVVKIAVNSDDWVICRHRYLMKREPAVKILP